MSKHRELIKSAAKRIGLYEWARNAKNSLYITLRDHKEVVRIGINYLLKEIPRDCAFRLSREFDDMQILNDIESRINAEKQGDASYQSGFSSPINLRALYIICRHLKPESVVETGVASGASSMTILTALKKNETGRLYSIDIPPSLWAEDLREYRKLDQVSLPKNKIPGWLIPEELKNRWELILGDSKTELGKLLTRLGKIQLFYHDAEHTYEAMSREFRMAWTCLTRGGFLTSDDVEWNRAFSDFSADAACANTARHWFGFGIIRKP